MTNNKITKKDMVEAITAHLSRQGKRMTNLKTASVEKLQELVERYKIDIQEFAVERKDEMKKQREIAKKAREKRQEEEEEMDRKWKEEHTAREKLTSVLDLDIFRLRDSIKKQLLDTIRYRNNKAEMDSVNERNKKECDQMFQKLQNEKPLILERVNDFTINVRGMFLQYGFKLGVQSHEFYINWSKSKCEYGLFGKVYDIGFLPTIVEQYKLYINGKADWIVEKQNRIKNRRKNRRKIDVDNWGETNTIMANEVFKFIADKLTDKEIAEVNEFIAKSREGLLECVVEKKKKKRSKK